MRPSTGTLYIVATPIGNLKDISLRAVEILQSVAWIGAEDTRHSAMLLKHYNIATPMKSLHEHNESERIHSIQKTLDEGKDVALISDAGTPLISDPGYTLVHQLVEKAYRVSPIPGACAAITALSASGLQTDRFLFVGFLPAKSGARIAQLEMLEDETATLVFYEAPHRLMDALKEMQQVFGEARKAVLARELSKNYENFVRGDLAQLIQHFETHEEEQRGEMVICIEGAEAKTKSTLEAEKILRILLQELPVKKAAALAAEITGLRKNDLYAMAIEKER